MPFVFKSLALLLSISVGVAADKETPFKAAPAASYASHQSNAQITIGVDAYVTVDKVKLAFGKLEPNQFGILPVLVVIQNDSGKAIRRSRPPRSRPSATRPAPARAPPRPTWAAGWPHHRCAGRRPAPPTTPPRRAAPPCPPPRSPDDRPPNGSARSAWPGRARRAARTPHCVAGAPRPRRTPPRSPRGSPSARRSTRR